MKIQKKWLVVTLMLLVISLGVAGLALLKFNLSPQINSLLPAVTTTVDSSPRKTATSTPTLLVSEKILSAKSVPLDSTVTQKGNDLLVLVNKNIRLPSDFVPDGLVSLTGVTASAGSMLRLEAASALKEMFAKAKKDGAALTVVSAYRSYSQQVAVFDGWVASAGLAQAEGFSARAGHSQHQLGTGVDLGTPGFNALSEAFADTKAGQWLSKNAWKYGFILSYPKGKEAVTGYNYEPWHYRYIGKENAQKLVNSGWILEVYLQKFGVW